MNEYLDYSGLQRYHELLLNKELSNKINIDEYEQDSHAIAIALNDIYKKIQELETAINKINQ